VLDAQQMSALRAGPNAVEVRVRKVDSPRAIGLCNRNAATRLSVVFRFSGTFAADLALVDPVPVDQYRRAGLTNLLTVNLTLRNNGPSAVRPGGGLSIDVCCPAEFFLLNLTPNPSAGIQPLGPPFTGCQVDETRKPSYLVTCELGDVLVGPVGVITLGMRVNFASTTFGEASTSIGWRIGRNGITDPVLDNNTRSVRFVWCGESATSTGCAAPTG
jgi:hypothetical protein